jgi:isochorismate hydrolase
MNVLTNNELSGFLKDNHIAELYITGLFAEACIKSTTVGAIRNNYKAVLIEDAIGSKNTKKKLASLLYCERKGANVISTYQLPDSITGKNDVNRTLITDLG